MLSAYMADQGAQDKSNAAQAQQFGQGLGEYQTEQEAQQNSNAAQQQDFLNNLQRYMTAYQAASQDYYMPLNAMTAVMNGQQVNMPAFNGAPNSTAGNGGGTDYLGAYTALGQYNSAAAAAKGAALGGLTSGLMGMGAAYLGK